MPWLLVAVTMLVGAGSGLLAALVPAAQAARMDVVAALAGRRELARPRRGWPIAAASSSSRAWRCAWRASSGGASSAPRSARRRSSSGSCSPARGRRRGRPAPLLPLPLRLAVRDGARNRAGTAPAVAAIMAAVAGITALAIGGASDFRQEQIEYQARLPMGSALVRPPLDRADAVGEAVRRDLPGVPVVPLKALPGRRDLHE